MKSFKIYNIRFSLMLIGIITTYPHLGVSQDTEKWTLPAGEPRHIPYQQPVWVESKKILKVQKKAGLLVVTGLQKGISLFRVGPRLIEVAVLSPGQRRTHAALETFIQKSLSFKAVFQEDKLYLKGVLLRLEDWRRIAHYCLTNSCDYIFAAETKNFPTNQIRQFIKEELLLQKLPDTSLTGSPPWALLAPKNSPYLDRLKLFAKSFGLGLHIEDATLESKKMIRIRLWLAEVSKRSFQNFGVSWPHELKIYSAQRGLVTDADAIVKLKALEEQGEAKSLAAPELVGLSGETSEFFAGGEFPIRLIQEKSQSVEWRKYGVILRFKPNADTSGRMRLGVTTELSSIDQMQVEGVPSLSTHRIESHFELVKSQVVALSGLVRNTQGKTHLGLPFLKDLPLLGALFRSQSFLDSKSEFVILVQPEILESNYE